MANLTEMFGGFRQENMKNDFLAIQMEALMNADQRDMNVNLESDKKASFTDAAGEAIDVSANLEGFDALAEEALGEDAFNDIAMESPESFAARWGTKEGREARWAEARSGNKYQQMLDNQHRDAAINAGFKGGSTPSWGGSEAAKGAAELRKSATTEGASKDCVCGECESCKNRMKATEEWEYGGDLGGSDLDKMLDSIPESSVEECVENFRALDDSMDGTSEQTDVRESLSAQIDLLLPNY